MGWSRSNFGPHPLKTKTLISAPVVRENRLSLMSVSNWLMRPAPSNFLKLGLRTNIFTTFISASVKQTHAHAVNTLTLTYEVGVKIRESDTGEDRCPRFWCNSLCPKLLLELEYSKNSKVFFIEICFLFVTLQDVIFCGFLAVMLTASAGLLAKEADFRERHGNDFSGWLYDRLVAAVVS